MKGLVSPMTQKILPLFLILSLTIISGCGGVTAPVTNEVQPPATPTPVPVATPAPTPTPAPNAYFNSSMIGQTWTFVNGYGDITTIAIETPGSGSAVHLGDVAWHYLPKGNCRAYWNPGDCNAELWFGLRENSDSSWSSFHQLVICSLCLPGHAEGTTDIVAQPGGYLIVPAGPGVNTNSGYQPYWQLDVLTWQSGINSNVPGTIPWRTASYMEDVVTPIYSGPALVSEQSENCPDACVHEKWYFAKNIGLVKVEQLASGSVTDNADPNVYMSRIP
jgi:hypothetical protein